MITIEEVILDRNRLSLPIASLLGRGSLADTRTPFAPVMDDMYDQFSGLKKVSRRADAGAPFAPVIDGMYDQFSGLKKVSRRTGVECPRSAMGR